LRGCGKLQGSTSCEVPFSTSSQPDKNLYVCACMIHEKLKMDEVSNKHI